MLMASHMSCEIMLGFILTGLVMLVDAGDQLCFNISNTTGCQLNATMIGPQDQIMNSMYPIPSVTSFCEMWLISASPGQTITISFEDFDVSATNNSCTHSYVAIGPSPCVVLCGTHYPSSYISVGSFVWIKYFYYETAGPLRRGIKLKYLIGSIPSSEPCLANGMYQCGNGKCILQSWVCNGVSECEDSSDERNCVTFAPVLKPPQNYACGAGKFGCLEKASRVYRCYRNQYRCDGIYQCADLSDELGCNTKNRPCQQQWLTDSSGWIASPVTMGCTSANCRSCQSVICIPGSGPLQLRFRKLMALGADNIGYIDLFDGQSPSDELLKRLNRDSSYSQPIESTENCIFISFHAHSANDLVFNATYQEKGVCLPDQFSCSLNERNCYERSQRCNTVWDCPISGGDELDCGVGCTNRYTCGSTSGRCYSAHERCDGVSHCVINMVDESHCSADQCGHHNGTFLCGNGQCVKESFVCDGNGDCVDRSDEVDCPLPAKVILSAVVGSLCCGLLLAIVLGITRRFYMLRTSEISRRSSRHQSPVTLIEEQIFARHSAPPLYHVAIATSRPYDEYQRELLEQERQRQRQPQANAAAFTTTSVDEPAETRLIAGGDNRILSGDDDDMIDVSPDAVSDVVGSSTHVDASAIGCLARWQRRPSKDHPGDGDALESTVEVDLENIVSTSVNDHSYAPVDEESSLASNSDDQPLVTV